MKINQDNCEHYFLLYLDDELSLEDRELVIAFIKEHPTHDKELQFLKQLKLKPTEIEFENKLSLYQISETDSMCLTYLENEMNLYEKKDFENKLANQSHLQKALQQWKGTILTQDNSISIEVGFKNTLYKKEAPIHSTWTRIPKKQWLSIAALLIIIIGVNIFKQKDNPSFTQDQKPNNSGLVKSTNTKAASLNNLIIFKEDKQKKEDHYERENNQETVLVNQTMDVQKPVPQRTVSQTNSAEAILMQKIEKENELITNQGSPISALTAMIEPISTMQSIAKIIEPEINNTQYEILETDDDNQTLYFGNLALDAKQFRGLGRKISVLFNRNKLEK